MLPVRVRFWRQGLSLAATLALSAGLYGQMDGFPAGQNANAGASPVNVMGVVVNANTGTPIQRALVQIGGRDMLTDHDGKFEFDGLTETRAMLRVTKPGYYFSLEPMNDGTKMLAANELSAPLTLRLYPEALLTGSITAPDGSPMPGVPIGAMRSWFDGTVHRWMPAGQTATTNIRGEFRIAVPPGEYRLRTFHITGQDDGNAIMPLVFPADTSGGNSDVIKLHSGEEQHFDLHPSVGRAYSVWVSLESTDPGMPMLQVHTASGSVFPVGAQVAGGNLYKVALPNGSYTLTATKYSPNGQQRAEQQIAETNVTVAGHDVSGVVLRFQTVPTVPVDIRVDPNLSDDGSTSAPPNPYALGLMLQRDSDEMDMGMNSVAPEMRNGEVEFRTTPGRYRLVARGNNSPWYVESATYGDRDLLRQVMSIAPGSGGQAMEITVSNQTGTLTGSASVHRAPQNGCWIYLIPTTPNAASVTAVQSFGNAGTFRARLAPGSYQAVAFEHLHSFNPRDSNSLAPYASHVKTVEIRAGEQTTLDLNAITDEEIQP